jgi:cell division transport system permease protein
MIAIPRLPLQLRLDLPLRQDASSRFLPWFIALMVYLATIGGIALIWLGDALRNWDAALTCTLTLQIPADTSDARIDVAIATLKQAKGVVSARLLDQSATTKLLQPWLGTSVPVDALPQPRLIDVRIDPKADIDYPTLRQHLDSIIPNAQLDSNRTWLGNMRSFARPVAGVIGVGVIVVTLLIVTIVIFTARIGLTIHRSVIELLHLLGAQDEYIARQFQNHALWLGLHGGLIGGGAALVTVIILGPTGYVLALPVPIAAHGVFDWRLWLLVIVAALAAGGVAMVTARMTVLRQLGRMP